MESPEQHQQPCYPYRPRISSSPRPTSLKRSRSKMNEYPAPSLDHHSYPGDMEVGPSASNSSQPLFANPQYRLPAPRQQLRPSFREQLPSLSHHSYDEYPIPLPHLPPVQSDALLIGDREVNVIEPGTGAAQEVIDLTGSDDPEPASSSPVIQHVHPPQSSRPAARWPRFSAEVINLEDSPPHSAGREIHSTNPQQERHRREIPNDDNNDVELIWERRVPPSSGNRWQEGQPINRHQTLRPIRHWPTDRMDHIIMRADRRQGLGANSETSTTTRNPSGAHYLSRVRSHVSRRISELVPTLDYTTPAFNMFGYALGGAAEASPPPAARPPREELEPAKEGFTRSPQEDDLLICPNCLQELCAGEEDLKRQVSVVKGCGHVYCGECAPKSRRKMAAKGRAAANKAKAASLSSNGKGKAGVAESLFSGNASIIKPINKCVIEGCGKKATSKDVIHVFL